MERGTRKRWSLRRFAGAVTAMAIASAIVLGVASEVSAGPRGQGGRGASCLIQTAGPQIRDEKLAELVAAGTITAGQQAAIADALSNGSVQAPRPCAGIDLIKDPVVGPAVLELLGLERIDVRIAWLEGQSLSELSTTQGVDRQTLIDTITAAIDARLTSGVESGRITAGRKAEIMADVPAVVDAAIDIHLGDVVEMLKTRSGTE
jgi:hypothetical protein